MSKKDKRRNKKMKPRRKGPDPNLEPCIMYPNRYQHQMDLLIKDVFPDKEKRFEYLRALRAGMETERTVALGEY